MNTRKPLFFLLASIFSMGNGIIVQAGVNAVNHNNLNLLGFVPHPNLRRTPNYYLKHYTYIEQINGESVSDLHADKAEKSKAVAGEFSVFCNRQTQGGFQTRAAENHQAI
ncbi:MAG: hypothetical protein R2941_16545 [Desulfobacterales bacterium]